MASEAALPPLESLIKPEQVPQIAAIAAEKDKYVQGVKNIWDNLNTLSPDDPEYVKQHKKLAQVTEFINNLTKKHKERAAAAAAAGSGRPAGEWLKCLEP